MLLRNDLFKLGTSQTEKTSNLLALPMKLMLALSPDAACLFTEWWSEAPHKNDKFAFKSLPKPKRKDVYMCSYRISKPILKMIAKALPKLSTNNAQAVFGSVSVPFGKVFLACKLQLHNSNKFARAPFSKLRGHRDFLVHDTSDYSIVSISS